MTCRIISLNKDDIYVKKVELGKYGIIKTSEDLMREDKQIILKIAYNEILWIRNKKTYEIEVNRELINVLFCKIVSLSELFSQCDLLSDEQKFELEDFYFNNEFEQIPVVKMIYGRCKNSMEFLDKIHRQYVTKIKFQKNQIVAIKSVAGSGKTTTLLNLAKQHSDKKILYIAFNKSLIIEIKDKLKRQGITNLIPQTFDALMRSIFIYKNEFEPNIADLKPQNLQNYVEWFDKKPYKLKQSYVGMMSKFCSQTEFNNIDEFCRAHYGSEKPLLKKLWEMMDKLELITFDTIRKIGQMRHWSTGYIDDIYDMIFIDESQDFDNIMLRILLDDTTIPKLFVGDPRQAIYEWRGCINAFDKLPEDRTTFIEFYSTFRVGDPACSDIREKFKNCWMISKSTNETKLYFDYENNNLPTDEPYVYLFRSWRSLLLTAKNIEKVWIYNYDTQIEYIKRLHAKLQISALSPDEMNEFADDLPMFLLKLSSEDLENLIEGINRNLCNTERESMVQMYTIHSYKGLENDIVRVYNDIDIINEPNLYYVALTRGMKSIYVNKQSSEDIFTQKAKTPWEIAKMKNSPKNSPKTSPTIKNNKVREYINIDEMDDDVNKMTKLFMSSTSGGKPVKEYNDMFEEMDKMTSKTKKEPTDKITLNMLLIDGHSVKEISEIRGIKEQTITEHIIKNMPHKDIHWNKFMSENEFNRIKKAYDLVGYNVLLRQIKGYVGDDIEYYKISIVKKFIMNE